MSAPIDPRVRVTLAACAVAAAALAGRTDPSRHAIMLSLEATIAVVLAVCERLDGRRLARALAFGAPPIVAFAALALTRPGTPILELPGGVTVTREGLAAAAGSAIAASSALLAIALVAATTAARDVERALLALAVPARAVAAGSLLLQQLSLLGDEARRTHRAAAVRGAPTKGPMAFLVSRGRLLSLFESSLLRGVALDRALAARGFSGRLPRAPLPPLAMRDRVLAAAGVLAAAALTFAPTR
ncbi:MAG: hypothetical protein JNJ88_10590 [Planctomycetes bacterium]|nr:hypothetical protein [Planctomycetota bacterium]